MGDNIINTTFVDEPTTFEIKINEKLGWIDKVYLTVNNVFVADAVHEKHITINTEIYSVFIATYTPIKVSSKEFANFHFIVGGHVYNCSPIYFEVESQ